MHHIMDGFQAAGLHAVALLQDEDCSWLQGAAEVGVDFQIRTHIFALEREEVELLGAADDLALFEDQPRMACSAADDQIQRLGLVKEHEDGPGCPRRLHRKDYAQGNPMFNGDSRIANCFASPVYEWSRTKRIELRIRVAAYANPGDFKPDTTRTELLQLASWPLLEH